MSRSVFPISSVPPPPDASQRSAGVPAHVAWVSRTTLAGWLSLGAAGWAYSMAKPVTHKIDRFFGVGRTRTWDPETLTLAGLFATTALIFAGAALVLAATQPKSGPTASARGAQILSVVVVVGILYALLSITRS